MVRRGVFPGSFDPLTIAHLALADAARSTCALDEVHLVVSEVPLAKADRRQAPVEERLAAIDDRRADRPWLRSGVTALQLLVDIARDFDVLVIGADKWLQLHDPTFYGDDEDRMRSALDALPLVAVAPRDGVVLQPAPQVVVLQLDDRFGPVSSTAVRSGAEEWRA